MTSFGTVLDIGLTVALIDVLNERRERRERVRRTAQKALTSIDYAESVWLGGGRALSKWELPALLSRVDGSDKAKSTSAPLP